MPRSTIKKPANCRLFLYSRKQIACYTANVFLPHFFNSEAETICITAFVIFAEPEKLNYGGFFSVNSATKFPLLSFVRSELSKSNFFACGELMSKLRSCRKNNFEWKIVLMSSSATGVSILFFPGKIAVLDHDFYRISRSEWTADDDSVIGSDYSIYMLSVVSY